MGVTAFKITGDTSVCSTASPVEQKQSTSKPWITLWVESAGDQWIPFTKDQHCGKRFHALMQTWHQQFGYLMLLQEPMEVVLSIPWWRHQMEAFSALLALCEGNHPLVTGGSPYKGQWCGALMFSLICAWTNDWANNRDAGDLRRQDAHYNVTVMLVPKSYVLGVELIAVSPGRRQAIIWTNAGIFLIGPLGTNFNEIWIKSETFLLTKMHLKHRLRNGGHIV